METLYHAASSGSLSPLRGEKVAGGRVRGATRTELRSAVQPLHPAVADDGIQLVQRRPRRERHDDRADLPRGEEELEVFDGVVRQDAEAVADFDALRRQHRRGALGASVQLRVREARARLDADEGELVGRYSRPLGEELLLKHSRNFSGCWR
jgi:hypothetical protein